MTLGQLLASDYSGYFFLNPTGLQYKILGGFPRDTTVKLSTEVVTVREGKRPEGWNQGLTSIKRHAEIFVDLERIMNWMKAKQIDTKLHNVRFTIVSG